MRQGGLADIRLAKEWMPPHINHRRGEQVDISMRGLTNWEKTCLQQAIGAAIPPFHFTVWAESPYNPNLCQPGDSGGCHWHIQ